MLGNQIKVKPTLGVSWVLTWRNGWVRMGNVVVRWNTDWMKPYGHCWLGVTNVRS
jgi:hypothetical protein